METSIIIVFTVLSLIVLGLSVYLGILYGRLRRKRQELARLELQAERNQAERESDICQSLQTLALVIIQEQCEPTEGCIRVKRLMDEIDYLKEREELAVFHEMYEEVKELAILQEYKDLSKQERFRQDNLRYAVEEKYGARLKQASQSLRDILSKPH